MDDLVSRTQACREQRESGLADGCPQPCSQRGKHGAGEINTPGHEAVSHGHLCVPQGNKMVTIQTVSPAGPVGQEDSKPAKLDISCPPRADVNTAR